MELKNYLLVPALVLSAGIILSSTIAAGTFYKAKALENNLSVTGSAKVQVKSDLAKLQGSFSRTVPMDEVSSGYKLMAQDAASIKQFFVANGIAGTDVTVSPLFMEKDYNYDSTGLAPKTYTLRQNVTVQMTDVVKATEIAQKTGELINKGVFYSASPTEFYYSQLAETRVSLLGDAVKDAAARAEKIATSGNRKLGNLKEASVGVTQVTALNSMDISDYGTYDTSGIDKEVLITIKATFNVR